ncbi:MAG: 2,5-diketo-D-gluconate reductase [Aliidongia sp.]|jgi:2,5-diketo-D-gluconate reductase A|nr:2,5-diketo-D-gluconate reductase [Aliidongia sp.]
MAEDTQPRIALNDGNTMPQMGFGVWQIAANETAAMVRGALMAGYRSFDAAAIYGNEEGVGAGIEDRTDVFITTKVWNTDQGFDETLRAFEASAKRMRRETVDLYLIHWPSPHRNRFVETWKALIRLKETGQAKSIGVSNFTAEHLERIIGETGIVPAVNQIELHPQFQQTALRAFHAAHSIQTEAWSPLGRGKLTGNPVIAGLAAKHGKTPAQIILRWHLDSGSIVIPRSVNAVHRRENFAALSFRLEATDLARIAALDRPDGRTGPDPVTAEF